MGRETETIMNIATEKLMAVQCADLFEGEPCAGAGGFLTQTAAAIYHTPPWVLDYVAKNSLLPCPLCGAEARTWTDIDTPVTYCRKNCSQGKRFYRATASASARAWNTYARALS